MFALIHVHIHTTTCILIMLYHWMKFQNSAQKQHVISSYHYMIGMSVTWPLTIFFMLIDQKPKIASEGIICQVVGASAMTCFLDIFLPEIQYLNHVIIIKTSLRQKPLALCPSLVKFGSG